jgi:uncharacterized protein
MILGVCSDTQSLQLPPQMLLAFKGMDMIIHAGDICDKDVIKTLKSLAPLKAVHGNMDDTALKLKLPAKLLFETEGVKIGVYHGHEGGGDALANAQQQFKNDAVDLVIFGHSHKPYNQKLGPTIFFNPGSPNDAVRAPYFSYGRIQLKNGTIEEKIVKI